MTEKTLSSSGRYGYIDIAKGIGILLVVFAHINVEGPIYQNIYTFHMPLFFVLAGLTFSCKAPPGRFFAKKARRLLLPYFIYAIVTLVWFALVETRVTESSSLSADGVTARSFIEIFLARGSTGFLNQDPPLWFVPCLFAAESIYYLLKKYTKTAVRITCVLGLCVLGYITALPGTPHAIKDLPWSVGTACAAMPFLLAGDLVSEKLTAGGIARVVSSKKALYALTAAAALFAVMGITAANAHFLTPDAKGHISMGSKHLGNIGLLYLGGLAGAYMVIVFSVLLSGAIKKRIEKGRSLLSWLGRNSFDIMAVHYPVKRRAAVLTAKIIEALRPGSVTGRYDVYTSARLGPSFIAFLITTAVSVLITAVIRIAAKRSKRA